MPLLMQGAPGNAAGRTAQNVAVQRIPFVRASHRYWEPAFDVTQALGAASVALGPFDVPPYGYIRAIRLLVTGSGGALDGGALAADFPWNVIRRITLQDTNGYPLVFPLTGYQLFLANLLGGYRGFNDPTLHPDYVGTVNTVWDLRLPVEITPWDGFGSLANQNPQSPFRVQFDVGSLTDVIVGGGGAEALTVRVRGYLEAWSPVPATNMRGQPQETAPPGHGATQFWSVETPNLAAASQQIPIRRVGNLIRNIILVFRTTAGARSATVEPDDLTLRWDGRNVRIREPNQTMRGDLRDATNISVPTGVLAYLFTDDQDGTAGFESRHLYLPTVPSTRLEFEGTFGAAGTVEILTNDLAESQLGR
jgi:hypothetical protein